MQLPAVLQYFKKHKQWLQKGNIWIDVAGNHSGAFL